MNTPQSVEKVMKLADEYARMCVSADNGNAVQPLVLRDKLQAAVDQLAKKT